MTKERLNTIKSIIMDLLEELGPLSIEGIKARLPSISEGAINEALNKMELDEEITQDKQLNFLSAKAY